MFIELNLNILNNISVTISAGNDNFIAVSIEGESINWTLLHQCHMMHHYDRKSPGFSLGKATYIRIKRF